MRSHLASPEPIGIYAYFDKIQFWVCNPLDNIESVVLEGACARGGIHIENQPARFNNWHRQYGQRVEIRQPEKKALQLLAGRDDALINRAEIALDLVFKYRAERDQLWEFLHQHLIRRWHRRRQGIRIIRNGIIVGSTADECGDGATRYDADRAARNGIAFYKEEYSRVTGEMNSLHLEWRLNGLRAVRSAVIKSGQDLMEFDHRAFWQKRLLLYTVNRPRLGRLLRNRSTGKRRRTPEIIQLGRYGYDVEGKMGEACARSYETVQELIDKLRSLCRIRLALVSISNEALLPKSDRISS